MLDEEAGFGNGRFLSHDGHGVIPFSSILSQVLLLPSSEFFETELCEIDPAPEFLFGSVRRVNGSPLRSSTSTE
jgi:hypothetical protein